MRIVIDLKKDASLADQIAQIVGVPEVDAAVDCVGFEARGHGQDAGVEHHDRSKRAQRRADALTDLGQVIPANPLGERGLTNEPVDQGEPILAVCAVDELTCAEAIERIRIDFEPGARSNFIS